MDQLKVLYQGRLDNSDGVTKVYSVPAVSVTDARKTQTLVTSIHVVGVSATLGDVNIWVVPDESVVPDASNREIVVGSITGGVALLETFIIELGMTLSYDSATKAPNGIYISTANTDAGIAYTIFGVEITND